MTKQLKGLYDITAYRAWKISAPYSSEKYLFAGSEKDAKEQASKIFKNWTYEPEIKEIEM